MKAEITGEIRHIDGGQSLMATLALAFGTLCW